MIDPLKAADKVINAIDDNYLSEQESEDIRTERQRIDTTSPFKLPHLIRPISFIWAMANQTILTVATIVAVFFAKNIDPNASNILMAALAANTTILATMTGFYYNGRKQEKITQSKANAAIKIEKLKTRHEIREERRDNKAERRK